MQCSSPYLLWKTPVWHLKVVAARRWGLGRVAIPVSMDWFPLYFMGKSMVSCRFSLEKIHWLLILTSLDRLFTLEASCGVVTVARCQRNDMEYNSYYRLSRNGVPKADFFHVSRMYNHQIDSISLFTSAQESPPPVNYTSNNHFNELTNPITREIWRFADKPIYWSYTVYTVVFCSSQYIVSNRTISYIYIYIYVYWWDNFDGEMPPKRHPKRHVLLV